LDFIQRQYLPKYAPHRKVLGVILPAAEAAVMATRTNAIGVLATLGTVETQTFSEEIHRLRPEATIYEQAAPELVSLIESGLHRSPEMKMMLRHYLQSLVKTNIDTLILGCNHYELIAEPIAEILGPNVTIIHEGPVVAERLQDYLFRHSDLSHALNQGGTKRILFTSHAEAFALMSKELFGAPVQAEDVVLK
jgi:glutamate racemase